MRLSSADSWAYPIPPACGVKDPYLMSERHWQLFPDAANQALRAFTRKFKEAS